MSKVNELNRRLDYMNALEVVLTVNEDELIKYYKELNDEDKVSFIHEMKNNFTDINSKIESFLNKID